MKTGILLFIFFAAISVFAQTSDVINDRLEASRDRFNAEGGREFLLENARGERVRLERSTTVQTDMGRENVEGYVEDASLERNYITSNAGGYELSPDATLARENLIPERYMRVRTSKSDYNALKASGFKVGSIPVSAWKSMVLAEQYGDPEAFDSFTHRIDNNFGHRFYVLF